MRGRYHYRKTRPIDKVLADYLLSDYYDKRESAIWQGQQTLPLATKRLSEAFIDWLEQQPEDVQGLYKNYFSSTTTIPAAAAANAMTKYKATKAIKNCRQRMCSLLTLF